MPGTSKRTADAAEQTALRGLSQSEPRGEADRARAILLRLEGRRAEDIAAPLVHTSAQLAGWRGCGGARGRDGNPRSLRHAARSPRRS